MGEKLQKHTLILFTLLTFTALQVKAQLYDFDNNMDDWVGYNATNQTLSYEMSEGLTGDGAIQLLRATGSSGGSNNGNNAGIKYDGAALDLDTYQYIRIRYKNETKGTSFRVQGYGGGNKVFTISPESDSYSTIYLDMSGEANWTGSQTGFSILVRSNAPDDANTYVYFDEIEFLTSIPATTYSEFIQNPSFEDPTGDSFLSGNINDATRAYIHSTTAKDGDGVLRFKYHQDQTITQYTFTTFEKTYSPAIASGTQLQVKMWVKTNRTTPFTMGVRLNTRMDNGAGGYVTQNLTENVTTTNTSMGWEELTFNFTTNQDTDIIRFWFAPVFAGTVNDFDTGDILYLDKLSSYVLAENTWTGTTDTDWATAGNWGSGSVPTSSDNVTIPSAPANQPVIGATTGVSVNDLTIDAGASLSVTSGGSIIVAGNSTGDITYNVAIADTNWHLVSSPVVGEGYDDAYVSANSIASGGGNNRGISTYDNGAPQPSIMHWRYMQAGDTGTFGSGTGYSMLRTAAGNYSFTGTFPTADVSLPITTNDQDDNLLGNPYPSYIDIAALLTANSSNLLSTHVAVYVWNGTAYTNLTTGYIHPGQAFFVSAGSASTTFSITEAMQSHQTGVTFYRSSNPSIALTLSNGTTTASTKVNYLEGKTVGLDPMFDVGMFNGVASNLSVYTQLIEGYEEVGFETQALPSSNLEAMIVPVGVKAAANSELTFSAEAMQLPSDMNVYLEDRLTNTFTRLDETNANYSVSITEALNGTGRFFIHTSRSALSTNDIALSTIGIYKSDENILRVTGLSQGNTTVKLFNVLGKQILSNSFNTNNGVQDIQLPKLATGVYIAQVESETGKVNKKIILE